MERELSISVELVVTILAITVVISILMFTVIVGNEVKEDSSEALSDVRDSISIEYVEDLDKGRVDSNMPAATAYNILSMYSSVIGYEASGFDNKVRDLKSEDSVLKNNLKGRVQLDIVDTPTGYVAFIQPLDDRGKIKNTTTSGLSKLNTTSKAKGTLSNGVWKKRWN